MEVGVLGFVFVFYIMGVFEVDAAEVSLPQYWADVEVSVGGGVAADGDWTKIIQELSS